MLFAYSTEHIRVKVYLGAQVFGESKPASGLEFGLDAWLMAVSTRGEPIEALPIKPTKKTANKKVSARESSVRSGK
jgi:hypothetical protein